MDTSANQPRFVSCPCQTCDGYIEFDTSHAGEAVTCPHCGLETTLFVPPSPTPPAPPKKNTPPPIVPTPPPRKKQIIPKGLQCPFCHSAENFFAKNVMTTQGWVTMIVGILLTPICIGIFLFFIAFAFQEKKYVCGNCGKTF
jgi:DNA-directed RNA polymerase subunit RPC12/RpoP